MPKPISLAQQIEEVEREIKLRESAFQSYGRSGKLRSSEVEFHIARMKAVLTTPRGVLHAKAVVADDDKVFVTSANLTEAALDRNIELGVLIRDQAFAQTVSGYFRILIDQRLVMPLPLA